MARAFDLYLMCREQTLVTLEVKKDKGKRIEYKAFPWTTGYKFPDDGGALSQPFRVMEFFRYFMAGDHIAASKQLKS